tara:strand:+ start:420 stop:587 length:168 start_codon:yes stop_codon:yes gene_type:complete
MNGARVKKTDILNFNIKFANLHVPMTQIIVSVLLMMNDVLAEDEYDGTGDFPSIL